MATDSFHFFGGLPTEIRQQIWIYRFPHLAIRRKKRQTPLVFKVFFAFQRNYPQPPCIFAPEILKAQTRTVRALMRIHSDTRAMMAGVFPDSFPISYHNMCDMTTPTKPPAKGIIRFNRERDIIFIEDCVWEIIPPIPLHLARTRPSDAHHGFFESVKNVAVSLSNYDNYTGPVVRHSALHHILGRIHGLGLRSLYLAWTEEDWGHGWRNRRQGYDISVRRQFFTQCYEPPTEWDERYEWIPAGLDSLKDTVAQEHHEFRLDYHGITLFRNNSDPTSPSYPGDVSSVLELRVMISRNRRRRVPPLGPVSDALPQILVWNGGLMFAGLE